MRILIVDDNADLLLTLKVFLERSGHEVDTCQNARDCLPCQEGKQTDALVTDIFMPDVDGLQMIREARLRWPSAVIVAMSGGGRFVQQDYLHVACELGADFALRKPFDPQELERKLTSLIKRRASATH